MLFIINPSYTFLKAIAYDVQATVEFNSFFLRQTNADLIKHIIDFICNLFADILTLFG